MSIIKKLPAALVAGMFFIGPTNVAANDHLVPEESALSGDPNDIQDYKALVASSFARVYQSDIAVRMIALPSFHPEYAVAMEHGDDNIYRILVLKPAVMLWSYPVLGMMKSGQIKVAKDAFGKNAVADPTFRKDNEGIAKLEAKLPPDPRDVKIDLCEKEIDKSLAGRIIDVWMGVTYRTRYDMPVVDKNGIQTVRIHADADVFHFSASGWDAPAGQIADPDPQSDPGRLLAVATAMQAYCARPEKGNLAALTEAVDILKRQLNH